MANEATSSAFQDLFVAGQECPRAESGLVRLPSLNTSAWCPSRGLGIEARVLNADCAGSKRKTAEMVFVPLLPPARSTLWFSWLLLVWMRVAVPERHPGGGIGPVVAVQVPEPEAGL